MPTSCGIFTLGTIIGAAVMPYLFMSIGDEPVKDLMVYDVDR